MKRFYKLLIAVALVGCGQQAFAQITFTGSNKVKTPSTQPVVKENIEPAKKDTPVAIQFKSDAETKTQPLEFSNIRIEDVDKNKQVTLAPNTPNPNQNIKLDLNKKQVVGDRVILVPLTEQGNNDIKTSKTYQEKLNTNSNNKEAVLPQKEQGLDKLYNTNKANFYKANKTKKRKLLDAINPKQYTKKGFAKEQAYRQNENAFPAKKKTQWAIGLQAGTSFLISDVRAKPGFTLGFNIQKALGHVFSLRYQSAFGQAFGQDWRIHTGQTRQKNYKLAFTDHSLQAVVALNNINFYKKERKVLVYTFAGIGLNTARVKQNLLDENDQFYDYSVVPTANDRSNRKDVLEAINNLQDNSYETVFLPNAFKARIKETRISPCVNFGGGLSFKLGKTADLNLEHRISWHKNDELDGFKYDNNSDWLNLTTIGVSLKMGKAKAQPLYWANPVAKTYEDVQQLKDEANNEEFLQDSDKDGVLDVFDKDLNTPENMPVTTRGVALDSDYDGVPDYKDHEMFTPVGAQVDDNGVALDQDNDGVPDIYDAEPNTKASTPVDINGQSIAANTTQTATTNTNVSLLGGGNILTSIFFDLNQHEVKKEFYPNLYTVIAFLEKNPNAVIKITGYADVRASEDYNLNLSAKRANATKNLFVNLFNIAPNQILLDFKGETEPAVKNANTELAHYINRRVTISVVE